MNKFAKTVIINRAVPGSGKTTIAGCIRRALSEKGLSIGKHSTDDFFMCGNRYCFDVRKLAEFHRRNLDAFEQDLKKGTDVVICDNTNLMPWQTAPYTDSARRHGYRVLFVNFAPRELWKHVRAQMVTPEKPDAHEVPEKQLARFITDFRQYDDLLTPGAKVFPTRHREYVWDNTAMQPVETGRESRGFDRDAVITILPDEYRRVQNEIGDMVLRHMTVC